MNRAARQAGRYNERMCERGKGKKNHKQNDINNIWLFGKEKLIANCVGEKQNAIARAIVKNSFSWVLCVIRCSATKLQHYTAASDSKNKLDKFFLICLSNGLFSVRLCKRNEREK